MQKKTYFIVTLSVLVLFAWFQIIMLNMGWSDNWVINIHATGPAVSDGLFADDFLQAPPADSAPESSNSKYYVISPDTSGIYETVTLTLKLLRLPFETCASLDLLPETAHDNLTGLIICTGSIDEIGDPHVISSYLAQGKEAVFAAKLDVNAESYPIYSEMLDIIRTGGEHEQESVDFLDDVLISGIYLDAEIDTVVNEVVLGGKSRVYAVGHEEEERTGGGIPVIWRTFSEGSPIYVVNSDMLADFSYMGVLTSILGLDKEAFVYPIVNSSIFLADGIPYYSDENSANLVTAYSRDPVLLQRDVIWSDLMAFVKTHQIKYTFLPYTGENQAAVESQLLQYFGKELSYNGCEWAYYDSRLLPEVFTNYNFATQHRYSFSGSMGELSLDRSAFGYSGENNVLLPVTCEGSELSSKDVFEALSMASGLGYSSHYADILSVFKDESGEDVWTQYKRNYGNSLFEILSRTGYISYDTAAEAAVKMKIFLSSKPETALDGDILTLNGQAIGDTYYILRTTKEVGKHTNCEVTPLHLGIYMVKTQEQDAVIELLEVK